MKRKMQRLLKNTDNFLSERVWTAGQKWDEKLERFTEMSNLSAPPKIYSEYIQIIWEKPNRGKIIIAGALVEYAIILYWKQRNHHR